MTIAQLAACIDQSLLRPNATRQETIALCQDAAPRGFAAVCILPTWVADATEVLAESGVAVCTVVGFPHGGAPAQAKAVEAAMAAADGAEEIDLVLNISALKSSADILVFDEIQSVVDAAAPAGAIVKVILECGYLTDPEKRRACQLAVEAGAAFVKTSTGFGPTGASVADVALLRAAVGPEFGVKAAGGIKTLADAQALLAAGANRLGTSAGVALLAALAESNL